jgi:hypothetical protein
METDEAMTRRALELLGSKRNDAYEAALAALREDTQAWWEDTPEDWYKPLIWLRFPKMRAIVRAVYFWSILERACRRAIANDFHGMTMNGIAGPNRSLGKNYWMQIRLPKKFGRGYIRLIGAYSRSLLLDSDSMTGFGICSPLIPENATSTMRIMRVRSRTIRRSF